MSKEIQNILISVIIIALTVVAVGYAWHVTTQQPEIKYQPTADSPEKSLGEMLKENMSSLPYER